MRTGNGDTTRSPRCARLAVFARRAIALGIVACADAPSRIAAPVPSVSRGSTSAVPVIDLGTLGGTGARVHGVSAAGYAVGLTYTATASTAFVWNGVSSQLLPFPAGTWSASQASDIRGTDLISGRLTDVSGVRFPAIWTASGGTWIAATLPTTALGAQVNAIVEDLNAAGQLVGAYWPQAGGSQLVAVWSQQSGVWVEQAVPVSGFTAVNQMGINDDGWIAGSGRTTDGSYGAFVFIPTVAGDFSAGRTIPLGHYNGTDQDITHGLAADAAVYGWESGSQTSIGLRWTPSSSGANAVYGPPTAVPSGVPSLTGISPDGALVGGASYLASFNAVPVPLAGSHADAIAVSPLAGSSGHLVGGTIVAGGTRHAAVWKLP